jgi:hypothetical protein
MAGRIPFAINASPGRQMIEPVNTSIPSGSKTTLIANPGLAGFTHLPEMPPFVIVLKRNVVLRGCDGTAL